MTTRAEIIAEARTWIGTRWHHQASRRGVGCDCIGLISGIARKLQIDGATEFDNCNETRGYGRSPDVVMLLTAADRFMNPIGVSLAVAGDVLLMRIASDPQHFALLVQDEPPRIIHAYAQARRVTEHGLDHTWTSRIVRAYRFRGID